MLNDEYTNGQMQEVIVMEDVNNANADPKTKNKRVVDTDATGVNLPYTNSMTDNEAQLGTIIGYRRAFVTAC